VEGASIRLFSSTPLGEGVLGRSDGTIFLGYLEQRILDVIFTDTKNDPDMTILVTGGAGRLGYWTASKLTDAGHSVKAFDLPQVNWSHVESLPNTTTHRGDITDIESVEKACRDAEAVVHLAAVLPPVSEGNRELTQRVNVQGTLNILEAAPPETPFVFASSIATYGVTHNETPPIKETHPQIAHNNYSESKIIAENAVKTSGRPYSVLRFAPISVADLLELPDEVPYRADQRVEFIVVEDAAHAIVRCLDEGPGEAVYNVAGGPSWQMRGEEYLTRFYGALGVEVEPVYSPSYTAVDWYDTSRSRHLGYQRTSFNTFEERLVALGEELGLR
jgi:nucleoside-diphosphate-sugar epimerase